VVGPIKTDFGWHLILVSETRNAAAPALADVHDQIAAQLQKDAISAVIDKVTSGATISRSDVVVDPALMHDLDLLNK